MDRYKGVTSIESDAIRAVCEMILCSKPVFDFADVLRLAGFSNQLPKLAIAKSYNRRIKLRNGTEGFWFQSADGWWAETIFEINLASVNLPNYDVRESAVAPVPIIPPEIQATRDHYIVWEPEWQVARLDPDPILCSRIGKTSMFAIEATWNMTELEAKIASGRLWER